MALFVQLVSALAWPILIAGIIFVFRSEMKPLLASVPSLAHRLKKMGPAEFQEANLDQQAAKAIEKPTQNKSVVDTLDDPLLKDRTLEPWTHKIEQALAENRWTDAPDLSQRLKRALAYSLRHNEFMKAAQLIFGSQVAALRELNANGARPAGSLHALHAEHKRRVEAGSETPLDFLTWLRFLIARDYVTTNSSGDYEITDLGRIFLSFANANDVTEARLY